MDLLLGLLFKFAPYIIMALGALGLYLGVRHKGAVAEREKWQKAQTAQQEAQQKKVAAAQSKDAAIDKKVKEKLDELEVKKENLPSSYKPGDPFKF